MAQARQADKQKGLSLWRCFATIQIKVASRIFFALLLQNIGRKRGDAPRHLLPPEPLPPVSRLRKPNAPVCIATRQTK